MSENNTQNLANRENFSQFFRRKIAPNLRAFEAQRIRTLILYRILNTLGVTLQGAILFFIFPTDNEISEAVFLPIIIFCGLAQWIKKSYTRKVKAKIFDTLFSFLGNFKYIENNSIFTTSAKYKAIPMIGNFNRTPVVDDYIEGTYKNLPVTIEELHLRYVSGSGKRRHERTVYKGLLFTFPQLKKTAATIITANRGFSYATKAKEIVKLEDVEYEKIYETSSDDQIEARYILTPKFMEKLKQLKAKKMNVAVCFHAKNIYIGIRTNKDMFEPSITRPVTDIVSYRQVINELKDILEIIDILELEKKAIL